MNRIFIHQELAMWKLEIGESLPFDEFPYQLPPGHDHLLLTRPSMGLQEMVLQLYPEQLVTLEERAFYFSNGMWERIR